MNSEIPINVPDPKTFTEKKKEQEQYFFTDKVLEQITTSFQYNKTIFQNPLSYPNYFHKKNLIKNLFFNLNG